MNSPPPGSSFEEHTGLGPPSRPSLPTVLGIGPIWNVTREWVAGLGGEGHVFRCSRGVVGVTGSGSELVLSEEGLGGL